jgi:hypothetical protein
MLAAHPAGRYRKKIITKLVEEYWKALMKNKKICCPHCGAHFFLFKEKQNPLKGRGNNQRIQLESAPEDLLDLMQHMPPKEVAKLCGISREEMREINQAFGAQAHWGAEQKPKEESI